MAQLVQADDQVVQAFTRRVHETLGATVRAVHWFGSRALRKASEDSDYDLLIETTKPLNASQRDAVLDITIDISSEYNALLDVHYYTTAELHSSPYARTPFVQRVLEEALVL